ncbi:MAG: transglutaminase domain-containing protein [Peptostreptococcaceae bacterium]|nr:transglutaminase domain-containing protein [Peptostreptococcaceae bacterium]
MGGKKFILLILISLAASVGITMLALSLTNKTGNIQRIDNANKKSSDKVDSILKKNPSDLSDYTEEEIVESEERIMAIIQDKVSEISPEIKIRVHPYLDIDNRIEILMDKLWYHKDATFTRSTYSWRTEDFRDYHLLTLHVKYHTSKEDDKMVNDFVSAWVKKNITQKMSDEEKVRKIHDHIVLSYEYDLGDKNKEVNGTSVHAACSLIKEKRGVCQGYATLFQKMANEAGIENILVYGIANVKKEAIENEEVVEEEETTYDGYEEEKPSYHLWNLVKVEGNWYHVDVTWDDISDPRFEGWIFYDYYLRSDNDMFGGHVWDNFKYPKAPNTYPNRPQMVEGTYNP